MDATISLDSFDTRLLALLAADARLTAAQLGERVGLSPSAAHRRVRLLEARGLIRGYRAQLAPEARGNPSTVFVAVTLRDQTRDTLAAFEDAVARCAQVAECHLMSGESDYLLKVEVPAADRYERIHRDVLAALPGVNRLVTQFSIRKIVGPD
jgi:DNA-binding Lrp family transcriptional regulator